MKKDQGFLIITRFIRQSAIIFLPNEQEIEIKLLDISPNMIAKIGISAPKEFDIVREELLRGSGYKKYLYEKRKSDDSAC